MRIKFLQKMMLYILNDSLASSAYLLVQLSSFTYFAFYVFYHCLETKFHEFFLYNVLILRGFSPGFPVSSIHKKLKSPNSTWNARTPLNALLGAIWCSVHRQNYILLLFTTFLCKFRCLTFHILTSYHSVILV